MVSWRAQPQDGCAPRLHARQASAPRRTPPPSGQEVDEDRQACRPWCAPVPRVGPNTAESGPRPWLPVGAERKGDPGRSKREPKGRRRRRAHLLRPRKKFSGREGRDRMAGGDDTTAPPQPGTRRASEVAPPEDAAQGSVAPTGGRCRSGWSATRVVGGRDLPQPPARAPTPEGRGSPRAWASWSGPFPDPASRADPSGSSHDGTKRSPGGVLAILASARAAWNELGQTRDWGSRSCSIWEKGAATGDISRSRPVHGNVAMSLEKDHQAGDLRTGPAVVRGWPVMAITPRRGWIAARRAIVAVVRRRIRPAPARVARQRPRVRITRPTKWSRATGTAGTCKRGSPRCSAAEEERDRLEPVWVSTATMLGPRRTRVLILGDSSLNKTGRMPDEPRVAM